MVAVSMSVPIKRAAFTMIAFKSRRRPPFGVPVKETTFSHFALMHAFSSAYVTRDTTSSASLISSFQHTSSQSHAVPLKIESKD